jgi:hypothetical protein
MKVAAHCGPTFRIVSILLIRAVWPKDILGPLDRYVTSVTKYVESSEKDGISEDKRHPDRETAVQQRRLTLPKAG